MKLAVLVFIFTISTFTYGIYTFASYRNTRSRTLFLNAETNARTNAPIDTFMSPEDADGHDRDGNSITKIKMDARKVSVGNADLVIQKAHVDSNIGPNVLKHVKGPDQIMPVQTIIDDESNGSNMERHKPRKRLGKRRNTVSENADGKVLVNGISEDRNVRGKCMRMNGPRRIMEPCKGHLSETLSGEADPRIIEADSLPDDPRLMPEIGNGHIATVIHSDTICMNGLYNGANTSSSRARIPSLVSFMVDSVYPNPGKFTKKYVLDMKNGVFREKFHSEYVDLEVRTYAHRLVTRVFVVAMDINVIKPLADNITINYHLNTGQQSADISFAQPICKDYVCSQTGETVKAEYSNIKPTTPVAIVHDQFNPLSLPSFLTGVTVYWFVSIGVNLTEAQYFYEKAQDLYTNGSIYTSHEKAWEELWNNGRIDVEGNRNLSTSIYSSLYYLLSSLPSHPDQYNWPFMGMSPGGLAHGTMGQDYAGHVFWDQDTWMFPSIMLLHSTIGKILVQSRLDKLTTAKLLAKSRGFPGAVFPWESAYTGFPTSTSETCSTNEIHISADVSFALRQYLFLTNDSDFLDHGGADTLIDLATFWAARVTLNPSTKLYEIHDVMGPDEYHYHQNNSVYTNTAARLAIESGVIAMIRRGQTPPSQWADIINNMYIPLDSQYQYHPEYDGYQRGTVVKQADVILLGFPLMAQTSTSITQNDLKYYSSVTPSGPAMTWGMFAVNWLEQGDIAAANRYFYKQFGNIRQPFNVWTENSDGSGAVNFHTGMGGYLQSILFGYGGIRILEDRLNFDPQLLPSVTSWNITGLDYGGNSFDMNFDKDDMLITLTKSLHPVAVYLYGSKTQETCILHQTQNFQRQKAAFIKP